MAKRALDVHEVEKRKLLKEIVSPGMCILDMGACRGYFSFLFAKIIRDQGKIYSFEPDPYNFLWLEKALECNDYSSISLVKTCVSDKDGEANLVKGKTSGKHTIEKVMQQKKAGKKMKVKKIKVDTFLRKEDIDPDLIKVDVEGAEEKVLNGAINLIRDSNKLKGVMDLHEGVDKRSIITLLRNNGYRIFDILNNLEEIEPNRDLDDLREIYFFKK